MLMTRTAKTFPAFDALRFFAALAVVLFHYALLVDGYSRVPLPLRNLMIGGPIALPFFFILSGFVLQHAYKFRTPDTPGRQKVFWQARIARLYPTYFLAWLIFLPMAYLKFCQHGTSGLKTFGISGLVSLFAVQSWTPWSQSWNGPGWSLSVEAFFYFCFPWLVSACAKLKTSVLLSISCFAWIAMMAITSLHVLNAIPDNLWNDAIRSNPLLWSPLFIIGIAAYRCQEGVESWRPRNAVLVGTACGVILLVAIAFVPGPVREILITSGATPLLVMIILTATHPTVGAMRIFNYPMLSRLGAASFVIYIIQAPLWHLYAASADRLWLAQRTTMPLFSFLLFLVLLLTLASLLQSVFEKRAREWVLAHFETRPTARDAALPPNIEAT
jgi:peptidoglycan/LPS O-acetylase OafA/YrhL